MKYIEWIVWTLLTLWTLTKFVTWLYKKRGYKSGRYYDTKEVITIYAIPKETFASTIILAAFVAFDFNKFHLLWIYPIVNFWIRLKITQWVQRKDEERLKKEIDK